MVHAFHPSLPTIYPSKLQGRHDIPSRLLVVAYPAVSGTSTASTTNSTGRQHRNAFRSMPNVGRNPTTPSSKVSPFSIRNITTSHVSLCGLKFYKESALVPESMIQFTKEIHQKERISRHEEQKLGKRVQEALNIQQVYQNLRGRLKREPSENEWVAACGFDNHTAARMQQILDQGKEAKDILVTANLRLVQGVVNTYIRNGLSAQYNAADMMQDGIIALMRAAEKFQPDNGFKFSTYAMYWIRSAVKASQLRQSRVVHIPRRLWESNKLLRKAKVELTAILDRPPSREELGKEVAMSPQNIDRCLTAMAQRHCSLDQSVSKYHLAPARVTTSSKMTLLEVVSSSVDDADFELVKSEERDRLRDELVGKLYRYLQPRDVELLKLRYGFVEDLTSKRKFRGLQAINDIASKVGISTDTVAQSLRRSLSFLQRVEKGEWKKFLTYA